MTAFFSELSVAAMDPAAQREYVQTNMDSDLQFILGESGVVLEHQVAIARRYGNLRKFSALGDDRASIRTACLQDFAIPGTEITDSIHRRCHPPFQVLFHHHLNRFFKRRLLLLVEFLLIYLVAMTAPYPRKFCPEVARFSGWIF